MARKRIQRPLGQRRYRKLFVVSAEGVKTEPRYFTALNRLLPLVHVHCLKGDHDSAPPHVLKRMNDYIKQGSLEPSDEAWLVVDRNHWEDGQLDELRDWAQKRGNCGFAVSNPNFEYWLLLHFEDGGGVASIKDCLHRLKRFLPHYDKEVRPGDITLEHVKAAIRRAKKRNNPSCEDWTRAPGCSTVYKLAVNILGDGAWADSSKPMSRTP